MKEKWQNLNAREQKLVIGMAVVVICFLFYSMIWQPLNDGIEKAQKKVDRQTELLAWVKEKTEIAKQSKSNRRSSGGSISSIVSKTAKRNNVVITRIQPTGDDIQVWIDQVVFSHFLQWLNQLVISEGLHVKAVDLSDTDQAGVVKVRRLQLGKS